MPDAARATPPSRPMRIVLVDPDATFRSVLSAYLVAHGFEVAAWADGRQALARLDELRPDLVLTELDSDDFDGLELAEAIARGPGAPKVALCTRLSAAGAWDKRALAAIGVRDVIVRPITFPLLTDRLRALLEEEAPVAKAQVVDAVAPDEVLLAAAGPEEPPPRTHGSPSKSSHGRKRRRAQAARAHK